LSDNEDAMRLATKNKELVFRAFSQRGT